MRAFATTAGVLGCLLVAVSGCPTVDLGETPPDPGVCRPDPSYFEDEIWPNYLAPSDPDKSCVGASGCHASENGRSALRLETDLGDAQAMSRNYAVVTRFLNCGSPDASSLLTKPLGGLDSHGGGDLFASTADPAVDTFRMWFP